MLKKLFVVLCLTFCLTLAAQSKRYELKVNDFNRINLLSGVNVNYYQSQDSAGCVVFEAAPSVADCLMFENAKGTLKIQTKFDDEAATTGPRTGLPTVTVYSSYLAEAKNSADSTLRVLTMLEVPEFKATLVGNGFIIVRDIDCTRFSASIKTGNGTIIASGKCDDASLSNTGKGTIQADALQSRQASCKFFGPGTTGVWATEKLTVKGTLGGKLFYKGNPVVKDYSMGIKIEPLSHQ